MRSWGGVSGYCRKRIVASFENCVEEFVAGQAVARLRNSTRRQTSRSCWKMAAQMPPERRRKRNCVAKNAENIENIEMKLIERGRYNANKSNVV